MTAITLAGFSTFPQFPGQSGFPVGFAATPSSAPSSWGNGTWPGIYPGSLTAWPGGTGNQTISGGTHATSGSGTALDPWVFAFFDFNSGSGGVQVSTSHVRFVGCRFQSNDHNNFNVQVSSGSGDISWIYCSCTPLAASWTSPPNGAWPSAGAGQQIDANNASYTNTGGFCVPADDGYQYGINLSPTGSIGGTIIVDHCDFWGFGNAAVVLYTSTSQVTITNNWIHDASNCNVTPTGGSTNNHTDGVGYLNGGSGPTNVTVSGNTIASIGNTNAIAWQKSTTSYANISVTNNYLSGYQNCVCMCNATGQAANNTNLTFENNYFATDLPWETNFGAVFGNATTLFTHASNPTNNWAGNKLKILPGTAPLSGVTPQWTSGQDGFFMYPDGSLHSTDFTG